MDSKPFFLTKCMLLSATLMLFARGLGEYDHPLARFAYTWFMWFEEEIDLSDAGGIYAAREAFAEEFVKLVPDFNLGQELGIGEYVLFVLCFATEACRKYRDHEHPRSRMDVDDNECLSYVQRHTIRSGLLDGGTPADKFSTDDAVELMKEHARFADTVPVCCRGVPECEAGNEWSALVKQLKAFLLVTGMSQAYCVLLFVLVGAMNIAFHVAYHFARTKEALHVHIMSLRSVDLLLGSSTFGVEEKRNKYVAWTFSPHPQFIMYGIANLLISTPEMLLLWTTHLFAVLRLFHGKKVHRSGVLVQAPASLDLLRYLYRRAKIDGRTEEEIAIEQAIRREACSRGGTNCWERHGAKWLFAWMRENPEEHALVCSGNGTKVSGWRTAAKCILSECMVIYGMLLDEAQEWLGEANPDAERIYQKEIDKFYDHLKEVRQYELDNRGRVYGVGDGSMSVALVQRTDSKYKELYSYIQYLRTLPLDDWRLNAWQNEGYDWTKWDEASSVEGIERHRKQPRIEDEDTATVETTEDTREEDDFDPDALFQDDD